MKKLFEKHSIFKLLVILVLLISIASWCFSTTYFSNGELIEQETIGLGYFDIITAVKIAVSNFFEMIGFIICVFAFYKILGSTRVYQDVTEKIANKVNTNVLMVIVLALTAVIASVISEPMTIMLFIPFAISIMSKANVDKVASIATTFGGAVIGTIASTYSTIVASTYKQSLSVELGDGILVQFALLFVLVAVMAVLAIKRNKASDDAIVDTFAPALEEKKTKAKKVSKKGGTIPFVIAISLFAIISLIAVIPWSDAFGVTVFTNLHESISKATLFGDTVIYNILGTTLGELGQWSYSNLCAFMVIFAIIIKIMYRIPFDKFLDEACEGIKNSLKAAVLVSIIYTILVIALSYPVLPGIMNSFLEFFGTNFFTILIVGLLTAIFVADPYYITAVISGAVVSYESANVAAFALQYGAGIAGLFVPTSILLVAGLSMFNVEYKDWMKFIWKFLLASLVITSLVLVVFLYI